MSETSNKNIIKEHYEDKKEYRPSPARALKTFKLIQNQLNNSVVLDIGCGDGTFGMKLESSGAKVYGCDISEQAILLAKEALTDARVINIESEPLDIFGVKFNIVIISEVIEHLFKPKQALMKINSVLKPDGMVIITTPNLLMWSNRIRMLFGQFKYTEIGLLDEGHIHFYTYKTLLEDLNEAGFEVKEENHVIHPKIPEFIGSHFPSLFAFQFIVKAKAKENGK